MNEKTAASPSALVAYPKQAAFGRVLAKAKIYAHSRVSARLKDLFVTQVDQIVWQYKLAPETINLPARPGVPEIQVISIRLKGSALHDDVLRCIDQAVPFPIVFELHCSRGEQEQTRVVAAYKRPSEADASRWVTSSYFMTGWLSSGSDRSPMPVVVHLGGLYEQLLHRLIPLQVRPQETLPDLVVRTEKVQVVQRELDKIAARLAREKQFNRKVEINAQLRQLKKDHAALIR